LAEFGRNPSRVLQTEAILRGSYFWPLSGNQTLEVGAEFAKNSHEQTIQVFFDLDGDGIPEKIDIFDPSSTVEELRTELFANHNWTLNSRWTASASLVAENSALTQRGVDINNETQFRFLKPRIDLRYAPNSSDQLRFKLERTVSQLNFGNFVPRYEIFQDRYSSGNPDLRPETAWEYELGFERRLTGDQGVVEARVYFKDIQDRIESVAIDPDGDGNFETASGNIGDATEYGTELNLSLRMTRLGLPNLIVDAGYLRRNSSVTDPFTGRERKMSTPQEYGVKLSVRHDISDRGLSYGASFEHDGGLFTRYEWREFRSYERKPHLDLFLEKRFRSRWIFRLDAVGLTGNVVERTRLFYADNAADGAVGERQFFKETRDRRYKVGLTATF